MTRILSTGSNDHMCRRWRLPIEATPWVPWLIDTIKGTRSARGSLVSRLHRVVTFLVSSCPSISKLRTRPTSVADRIPTKPGSRFARNVQSLLYPLLLSVSAVMIPARTVLFARRSLLAQARPLSRGFAMSMRLREYLLFFRGSCSSGTCPAGGVHALQSG